MTAFGEAGKHRIRFVHCQRGFDWREAIGITHLYEELLLASDASAGVSLIPLTEQQHPTSNESDQDGQHEGVIDGAPRLRLSAPHRYLVSKLLRGLNCASAPCFPTKRKKCV